VQAPTLLVIAADLRKMRLSASIDESDVGAIHAGQRATFRVGAYPNACSAAPWNSSG
jgi:HlyD family secretion protein